MRELIKLVLFIFILYGLVAGGYIVGKIIAKGTMCHEDTSDHRPYNYQVGVANV